MHVIVSFLKLVQTEDAHCSLALLTTCGVCNYIFAKSAFDQIHIFYRELVENLSRDTTKSGAGRGQVWYLEIGW